MTTHATSRSRLAMPDIIRPLLQQHDHNLRIADSPETVCSLPPRLRINPHLPPEMLNTILQSTDCDQLSNICLVNKEYRAATAGLHDLDRLVYRVRHPSPADSLALRLQSLRELASAMIRSTDFPPAFVGTSIQALVSGMLVAVKNFYDAPTHIDHAALLEDIFFVLNGVSRHAPREAARLLLQLSDMDAIQDDPLVFQNLRLAPEELPDPHRRIAVLIALYETGAVTRTITNSVPIEDWFVTAQGLDLADVTKLATGIVDCVERLSDSCTVTPAMFSVFFALTGRTASPDLERRFLQAMINNTVATRARSEPGPETDELNTLIDEIVSKTNSLSGDAHSEARRQLRYRLEVACIYYLSSASAQNIIAAIPAEHKPPTEAPFKIAVLQELLEHSPLQDWDDVGRLESLCSELSTAEQVRFLDGMKRSWFGDTMAPWAEFFVFYLFQIKDFSPAQQARLIGNLGRLMVSEDDRNQLMEMLFDEQPETRYRHLPTLIRLFEPENRLIMLCGLVEAWQYMPPKSDHSRRLDKFIEDERSKLRNSRLPRLDRPLSTDIVLTKWMQARNFYRSSTLDFSVESRAMERLGLPGTAELARQLSRSTKFLSDAANSCDPRLHRRSCRDTATKPVQSRHGRLTSSAPSVIYSSGRSALRIGPNTGG